MDNLAVTLVLLPLVGITIISSADFTSDCIGSEDALKNNYNCTIEETLDSRSTQGPLNENRIAEEPGLIGLTGAGGTKRPAGEFETVNPNVIDVNGIQMPGVVVLHGTEPHAYSGRHLTFLTKEGFLYRVADAETVSLEGGNMYFTDRNCYGEAYVAASHMQRVFVSNKKLWFGSSGELYENIRYRSKSGPAGCSDGLTGTTEGHMVRAFHNEPSLTGVSRRSWKGPVRIQH